MLVQVQEQKQKVKLSQILKNATEEQCFGGFMKISENTDLDEDYQTTSTTKSVKVCVNGLLMSRAGIGDESSANLSVYASQPLESLDTFSRQNVICFINIILKSNSATLKVMTAPNNSSPPKDQIPTEYNEEQTQRVVR
jgi:hypothetical protein